MRRLKVELFELGLVPLLLIPNTTGNIGLLTDAKASQSTEDSLRQRVNDLQGQVYALSKRLSDWAQLGIFREANDQLKASHQVTSPVVFIGDSITSQWSIVPSGFFPGKHYLNRGIGGQITGQMLLRFQQDVLELNPSAVVILGGINEIGWGTKEERLKIIEANLTSMAQLAEFNHVPVVISSLTPKARGEGGAEQKDRILDLNKWISAYCSKNGCTYLDYYSKMTLPDGTTREELFNDGTHPNDAGYKVMSAEANVALGRILNSH